MMRSTIAAVLTALLLGCGTDTYKDPNGTISFDPQRPELGTPGTVTPYTGSDPIVLEAQTKMPNGLELQRKVILRTCGPTNGVCHNQKEYPDMHTTGTFASTINAPCNLQPGTYSSVFDRCERPGDHFLMEEQKIKDIEIGWYEVIVGAYVEYRDDETPPSDAAGLHLHLREPVPLPQGRAQWSSGTFLRNFTNAQGDKELLSFATYNTRWWVLDDGRHLYGEVHDYQAEDVEELQRVGIIQGDQNRNDNFGAVDGKPRVPLINPGNPEESYLIGRLRGHMVGDPIPGTRMPLANQPPSVTDMLALMCWIQGLDPEATTWNLASPINYAGCSYSANPEALSLVGAGVTWRQRVWPILQSSCGGCHGGANPQAGLDMLSDGAWARLRNLSAGNPTLKYIDPGRPEKSYLWLKLSGDGSIVGRQMPLDPLNSGSRVLPPDQLDSIQTWILAGALEDG